MGREDERGEAHDSIFGKDLFAILGVSQEATVEEIKAAWKQRTAIVHPDRHGGNQAASEWAKDLAEAKDTLTDPARRARYLAGREQYLGRSSGAGTRVEKLEMSAEAAQLGGTFTWVDESAGHRAERRLKIPPGVSNGHSLRCPAEIIGGHTFGAWEFIVVVEQPLHPPEPKPPSDFDDFVRIYMATLRRDAPSPPPKPPPPDHEPPGQRSRNGKPSGESTRDGRGHWSWLAAACVVVLSVGVAWWVFAGQGGSQEPEAEAESSPVSIGSPGTPSPPVSVAPAEPTAASPDATSQLWTLDEESKATLRSWPVGSWVPQVSAKCEGMKSVDLADASGRLAYPDGSAESFPQGIDAAQILEFHQALNQRSNGTIELVRAEPDPSLGCSPPNLWVSLADVPRQTKSEIEAWCADRQFPDDECAPHEFTQEEAEDATYSWQGDATEGFGLQVPYSMEASAITRGVLFTDPASGSKLLVQARDPDADASTAQDLAVAKAEVADVVQSLTVEEAYDGGFRLSGTTADGKVFYWREYRAGLVEFHLYWEYPQELKAQFDPAVVRSTATFEVADGP